MTITAPLLCCMSLIAAVADEIPSGPDAGSALEPLQVSVAAGEKLGETLDAVADRGAKPTIYVFVRADQFDRPMARVLKNIDDAFATGIDSAPDAALVAVWITDTPEKSREYLPLAQQSLKLTKTRWTVFEGGKNGPEGWSLNDAAGLTAFSARDGKVLKSTGFSSWNERDARSLLQAFKSE